MKIFVDKPALRISLIASVLLGLGSNPVFAQEVIYYHTDALGSPVATTDSSGTVIKRTEYEPYGKVLNKPLADGPGYTGHVSDAETGLSYMQQRYFDPGIGRFLSVDPVTADLKSGKNFNRYWYANNSPFNFSDPDGRQAFRMTATPDQAAAVASSRAAQQKIQAGEQRVAPKSVSIAASMGAESGTPAIAGSGQVSAGIKFSGNSEPGPADNFYLTGAASAGGLMTGSVSTASNQVTDDFVIGASIALPGPEVSISSEGGGVRQGTSRVSTVSTPVLSVSWSLSGDGDWTLGVSGPALGLSYKEQTVRTCSECLK